MDEAGYLSCCPVGCGEGIAEMLFFCCVARLSGEYWGKGRNLTKDSYPAEDLIITPEAQRKYFFVQVNYISII